jgi:hypothetical protein
MRGREYTQLVQVKVISLYVQTIFFARRATIRYRGIWVNITGREGLVSPGDGFAVHEYRRASSREASCCA